MMLKEYQKRALHTVQELLDQLAEWRDKQAKALRIDPDFRIDWVQEAWRKTVPERRYLSRQTGLGEPLPSFCLKIPTGGGKTLIATKVIDLVNIRYLRRQTGLVLWVVPTTQIYNQTLRALQDLRHPYRQQLDLASAGRTTVLEKTRRFNPPDVRESLCVLLLMLPSANRETKAQLRMFRDSGGFMRFFPAERDVKGNQKLLERVPNLDTIGKESGVYGRLPKTSLGNTLRLLRPLVILDEGHRAYSPNAKATLEGFNPSMIVELTATPPKDANVLVDIPGTELNAEEMIKLDLHVRNRTGASWQDTLLQAVEHRARLEAEATKHEAATGRYIRPICLIQVERTGRDQRSAGMVHAEDARQYLLQHPDIRAKHIAIKTSGRDDLKEIDRAGGLLSRNCHVRFIITKQALQEGWDCSFAYVLAILTKPSSKSALTQLVGRILRQPHAKKTGNRWLDESYVFCYQRRGIDLLREVRKGFGIEGLQGLEGKIVEDDQDAEGPSKVVVTRPRERYREAARGFVLPAFMIEDDGRWRLVSYKADILSRVPWDDVDVSPVFEMDLGEAGQPDFELRAGLDTEPFLMERESTADGATAANAGIDLYFAAYHLYDFLPNAWRGAEVARDVFTALIDKYSHKRVRDNYMFVLETLRRHLEVERDRLSRQVFAELLDAGTVRFIVVADDLDFNRLPTRIVKSAEAKQANREDGRQFQRNLFDTTTEDELNGLERKVATYLDQQARLFFWYRNRARTDYYVQGWKPRRIYADFIFTLSPDEEDADDAFHRVFVVETKGVHLEHAEDTDYKRAVFDLCSQHAEKADWAEFVPAMQNKVVRYEIVDEAEWQQRLQAMFG